ncbi:FkbM family methyltransferase [Solirubrobacter ginsenosidimutans]|uniref:FkbM family methyltransferase n=1 Tax=Solirubrobacter ginsenosidimutans TaxID=490573 RepID=A0A9X3N225_9ACTN|nr:FkbM family methyltransferase [Solirubrobacter ginsenosidimutans]MDA0166945.1 FkbM family methyltransferase [Solirubrobacter ginsenosidimutans]
MTWRAIRVVRGRGRFLALQLGSDRVGQYQLRHSGLRFHVRHKTGDVLILNKIFARADVANSYPPPQAVAAMIEANGAPKILDVGANIGMFGVFAFDTWPNAQVTAFEPDPDNLRILRKTVAANDVGDRWTVVDRAVSNAVGELEFVPGLRAEAHIAGADEQGAISVATVDLFDQVTEPVDLIKMDIEGGEWAILADKRLKELRTSALRLEWHTMLCPEADARAEAIRLLHEGGFTRVLDGSHEHDHNGVLWAWREPSSGAA